MKSENRAMILSSVRRMPIISSFVEETSRDQCLELLHVTLTFNSLAHVAEIQNQTRWVQRHDITAEDCTVAAAVKLRISAKG